MSHLTPRYFYDRLRLAVHQRRHPSAPWLAASAAALLNTMLVPATDVAIEWGAGRSTAWLGRRVKRLTSVEHDPAWHATVTGMTAAAGLTNVEHLAIRLDEAAGAGSAYVRAADRFADGELTFALVDGALLRVECAMAAVAKLAPGGVLVLDNAQLYVDHRSRSPHNRYGRGPADRPWADFAEAVRDWRLIWTTNGVWDTAIWVRPG